MGLVRANMIPILQEHAARPLYGEVLFLGHPDIYFNLETFLQMCRSTGVVVDATTMTPELDPKFREKGYCSARSIFGALGVKSIASLDASGFEAADFIFDLNSDALPKELEGRFDLIIDHGTMEHVFHIPNCLQNIGRMLRNNGRIVHSSPGNNCFDHGFYQFSPTLFRDYYGINEWRIESHIVTQTTSNQESEPPFFTFYEPDLFAPLSHGGLDGKLYGSVFVATKTSNSTGDRIPQQGYYARMVDWKRKQLPASEAKNAWSSEALGNGLRLKGLRDSLNRVLFVRK